LICPADDRFAATNFTFLSNSNISFFIGLDATETDPQSFLSGDRNLTNGTPIQNGILKLMPNRATGWIYTAGDAGTHLQIQQSDYVIRIDVGARKLTIDDGTGSLGTWTVAVGAPKTPTPTGRTFLLALLAPPQPTYSPAARRAGRGHAVASEADGLPIKPLQVRPASCSALFTTPPVGGDFAVAKAMEKTFSTSLQNMPSSLYIKARSMGGGATLPCARERNVIEMRRSARPSTPCKYW